MNHPEVATAGAVDPILAALSVPDDGVLPPTRQKTDSRVGQIAQLDPGEVTSFVKTIDTHQSLAQALANLPDLCAAMRNSIMSSVRQATARTGLVYTVEVTELTTPQRNMYVVAIVKCGPTL